MLWGWIWEETRLIPVVRDLSFRAIFLIDAPFAPHLAVARNAAALCKAKRLRNGIFDFNLPGFAPPVMPDSLPPGLLSIARALGISKMSVSTALRDKPGVSTALRARVKAEAERQGYRPDPQSAELMAMVRARRHRDGGRTIAFVNTFTDPTLLTRIDGYRQFLEGARARALEYGYHVDVFEARANGMTAARLADILHARGITGVLIGPRWALEPPIEFPWERYTSVLVGETEYGPNLHRVCNHHPHSCATVLRRLADKGYRRIGLALQRSFEAKSGYDHLMGAEQFRLSDDRGVEVIPYLPEEWDDAECEAWAIRSGLDCVVSLSERPFRIVDRVRAPGGGKLGFALLTTIPGTPYSGINQHTVEIGSAAVDLLRGLLLDGQRGTVALPRVVLVEGEWFEGETTPGPGSSRANRPVRSRSRR